LARFRESPWRDRCALLPRPRCGQRFPPGSPAPPFPRGNSSPRRSAPAASGGDDHSRANAGEGVQGWTLRSVPCQLREAIAVRGEVVRSRASRSVAATVSEDAGRAGNPRGGHPGMGGSVAGVTELDFALIGHQESWRAAADVLAVLRGPERTPLPDDEIKDILPWIPPRAVCHVDVGS